MTDDWSLKQEVIWSNREKKYYYPKERIQLLRQKLIEDIKKVTPNMNIYKAGIVVNEKGLSKYQKGYYSAMVDCIIYINHRFGISEDEVKE